MDKCRIVIWFLGIIFFIFNILTLFFTIWTHVSLKVLFYISFFALCSIYIIILLNEISISGKYLENFNNKFKKHFNLFNLIVYFIIIYFYIIYFINLLRFDKFIRNCPFYLDKLDYSLNFDRRCELYNINYNSRYSYQYICSYDSSKEFIDINKKKLKQEVIPDKVICIKINELIDNAIINKFKEVYNKKDKYYCSRTNKPQENDYSFFKAEDCRRSKYQLSSCIPLAYIYPMLYILIIHWENKRKRFRNNDDHLTAVNNNRFRRTIFRADVDRFNIMPIFNLRRNRDIINNANSSNNSTQRSENLGRDIYFRPEKTINIIIENKKKYIIDQNIKNISSDKTNRIVNQINSGNINDLNLNSEEAIIRDSNFNDNNINN